MGKPMELIETILSGDYDPGRGRVVELRTSALAEGMRARARSIASFAGSEAAELQEAASRLDGADRVVRIAAIDAAALMGTRAAVLAR
jgi:hypothetical protein